jgi:hypothetical protein
MAPGQSQKSITFFLLGLGPHASLPGRHDWTLFFIATGADNISVINLFMSSKKFLVYTNPLAR